MCGSLIGIDEVDRKYHIKYSTGGSIQITIEICATSRQNTLQPVDTFFEQSSQEIDACCAIIIRNQ